MPQQQRTARLTLDLDRTQHRKLKAWAQQAADAIGVVDVPVAVVLRRLVDTLTLDPADERYDLLARELQRDVIAYLRDEQGAPENAS